MCAAQTAFRVLVVDDDPDMAALLARMHRPRGHARRRSARRRRRARGGWPPRRPICVLLDVMLPGRERLRGLPAAENRSAHRAHPGGAGDRARGPRQPRARHRGRRGRFPLQAGAARGAGGAGKDAAAPARDAPRARGASPRRRGRAQGCDPQGVRALRLAAAHRPDHRRARRAMRRSRRRPSAPTWWCCSRTCAGLPASPRRPGCTMSSTC